MNSKSPTPTPEVHNDDHNRFRCVLPWNQYLLDIERAKARGEIAPSFEEWAKARGIDIQQQRGKAWRNKSV